MNGANQQQVKERLSSLLKILPGFQISGPSTPPHSVKRPGRAVRSDWHPA